VDAKQPLRRAEPAGRGADGLVDDLVDGDFDWRQAVRTYPLPVLALAALGGFFLGRRYGLQLLGDLSAFAADELLRQVPKAFEGPWSEADEGSPRSPH
jgi:hypothetical protein